MRLFAPVPYNRLESLLVDYQQDRQRIERVHAVVQGELGRAVGYFLDGNPLEDWRHNPPIDRLSPFHLTTGR